MDVVSFFLWKTSIPKSQRGESLCCHAPVERWSKFLCCFNYFCELFCTFSQVVKTGESHWRPAVFDEGLRYLGVANAIWYWPAHFSTHSFALIVTVALVVSVRVLTAIIWKFHSLACIGRPPFIPLAGFLKKEIRSEEGQKETSRVDGPANNGAEVRITEISSSQVLKLPSIFEKYAFVQRKKKLDRYWSTAFQNMSCIL